MKLMIAVYPPDAGPGGSGRLFEREVTWPWTPEPGRDLLQILRSEEDGEWYAEVEIQRIWFTPDGPETCELVPFQIDPNANAVRYCDGKYRAKWNSEVDGDLVAQLLTSGWAEWRSW